MNRTLFTLPLLLIVCTVSAQRVFSKKENTWLYPTCHTGSFSEKFHGVTVEDPYHWMEKTDSDSTKQWLRAQENFYNNYFYKIQTLPLHQLISELRSLHSYQYLKYNTPYKQGKYFFKFARIDGASSPVLLIKDSLRGKERTLISPGDIMSKEPLSISSFKVSANSGFLAYTLSSPGSEISNQLRVIKLPKGKKTDDLIHGVVPNTIEWHDEGFYYTKNADLLLKKYNVYYHRLGSPAYQDELIFKGGEDEFVLCRMSSDRRMIVLQISKNVRSTSKIYYKDLSKSYGFQLLVTKFQDQLQFVDSKDGKLLFYTNYNAPNFQIVSIDPANPLVWEPFFPEFPEHTLDEMIMSGDRMIVNQFGADGYHLGIFDTNFLRLHTLDAPPGYTLSAMGVLDHKIYYQMQSFTYPPVIYSVDLYNFEITKFDTTEVMYDPQDYITRQLFYPSKDSTLIPIYVCHKKSYTPSGSDITLLDVYGGYGIKRVNKYDPNILYFLQKGGVYAYAEVRGGGYYGSKWHKAGAGMNKQTAIDDVIAAGNFLINSGYTNSDKLAVTGSSHGGMLVGAAITQEPELFQVAIPVVGVFDMLHYEKSKYGKQNVPEYGSVSDSSEFQNLLSYSPLQKLKKGTNYPAILVITAENDERVPAHQSYKFVAALQNANPGGNPVLLKVESKAGHTGRTDLYSQLELNFDILMFLFCNTNYMDEFSKSTYLD